MCLVHVTRAKVQYFLTQPTSFAMFKLSIYILRITHREIIFVYALCKNKELTAGLFSRLADSLDNISANHWINVENLFLENIGKYKFLFTLCKLDINQFFILVDFHNTSFQKSCR